MGARVLNQRSAMLSRPSAEMMEAMTLPDLAEPHEFRHVSLYHAARA